MRRTKNLFDKLVEFFGGRYDLYVGSRSTGKSQLLKEITLLDEQVIKAYRLVDLINGVSPELLPKLKNIRRNRNGKTMIKYKSILDK